MPHYQTSDGLKLYYTDRGEGLPILCLPGLTRNSRDFDFVAPHLADHRLICLDPRGRGASAPSLSPTSYTVPVETRDVIELLDHLELDRVAIIGTSRGGLVAMLLGLMAGDRLMGVCFNDVGPHVEPETAAMILEYLGKPPPWSTLDEAEAAWPAQKPGFANVPDGRYREEVERLFVETDQGLALPYDPALRFAVEEATKHPTPNIWPLYDSLGDIPLAVIHGQNSTVLSADTVDEMKQRNPDLIVGSVPDRGHIPYLDEPQSLEAIHAWIGKLQ